MSHDVSRADLLSDAEATTEMIHALDLTVEARARKMNALRQSAEARIELDEAEVAENNAHEELYFWQSLLAERRRNIA